VGERLAGGLGRQRGSSTFSISTPKPRARCPSAQRRISLEQNLPETGCCWPSASVLSGHLDDVLAVTRT
jgi:hypothetical protein